MANGASFASLMLAKRGVVATRKTLDEATQASRADAVGAVSAADGTPAEAPAPIAGDAGAQVREATEAGAAVADSGGQASSNGVFAQLAAKYAAASAPVATLAPPALPEYRETASQPFAALVQRTERASVRQLRQDMAAVRILTRLVSGVAFRPGGGACKEVKTQALTDMLQELHEASRIFFEQAGEPELEGKSGWARSMLIDGLSEIVAHRWERYDYDEVPDARQCAKAVAGAFAQAGVDEALGQVLDVFQAGGYRAAEGPDAAQIARQRVQASSRLAAWDLYEAVMNPKLGQGDFRYTWGRSAQEVVQCLLPGVLKVARETLPVIDDVESRTIAMQAAVRRVASLVGAEYVGTTRQRMNHLAQEGITRAECRQREEEAKTAFPGVMSEILRRASANFVAIESMASQLLERPSEAFTTPSSSPLPRPRAA